MLLLRFAVVLAVSFLAFPLSAQDSPRREPQAVALLARSHAAMGGANLPAIRDTEFEADIVSSRPGSVSSIAVTVKTLGTNSLRIESNSSAGPSVFVVNNQRASARAGSGEIQFLSRASVANGGITQIPVLSVLSRWNEAGASLEYVGLEKLDGTEAHHVRLTPPLAADFPKELQSPCEVYIDVQSLLVLKLVYLVRPPKNLKVSVPVEVVYSDYRAASGLVIPFQMKYTMRGQQLRQYRIKSFSVNQGAQPADFELR